MKGHRYTIMVFEHGWLLCSPDGATGIPITALSEVEPLVKRGGFLAPGVDHHYRTTLIPSAVIAVVPNAKASAAWRAEIVADVATRWPSSPERQWWHGVDVGASSTSIFAALANRDHYGYLTSGQTCGHVPHDGADFYRCVRLLEKIPAWRDRLDEVAAKYPGTKWPRIVAEWADLEGMNPAACSKRLCEINEHV